MGETKQTLNIRAEEHITAIKSASKKSHCWKCNHDFDWELKKYCTLRKTGKQEPPKSQSTQKKTSIISLEYPSKLPNIWKPILATRKQSKENNRQNYSIIKRSPQMSANKYCSFLSASKINQSEITLRMFEDGSF